MGTSSAHNAAVHKIFGYPAELVGRPVEILLPERLRGEHAAKRDKYLTAPVNRSMGEGLKLLGRRQDGTEFPVEVNLSPLPTGRQVCVVCVVRDISTRVRQQADLERAEVRYRTVVEQMPAVTFMASLEGGDGATGEMYVSPQIERLLGFSQAEWLGSPMLWYSRLHPDDRDRWHVEFAQTCAYGTDFCAGVSVLREGWQRRLGARRGEDDPRRRRRSADAAWHRLRHHRA